MWRGSMRTEGRSRLVTIGAAAAFVLTSSLLFFPRIAGAEAAESAGQSPPNVDLTVLDTEGVAHSLRANPDRAALVVVFLGTECPIANGCLPELNRQFAELVEADSHVAFFGVISDRWVTRAAAAKHAALFKIRFPVLFDASGALAEALQPTHTPEAFVVDREGRLAYRGRIDDLYADIGKKRTEPSRHDLADAIADVLAARPVATPRTEPVGCLHEPARGKKEHAAVTYTRDIAPILQAHCVQCHRDDEIAPFPLVSYADVSKRARQLVRVTQSRLMPPWKPEPGFGHFLNERRLTDRERALLAEWAKAGTPEGDPENLPPPPKFAEGWQLGEPDLTVKIEEPFEVPAGGRDVFRNFVIPVDLTEDKLVSVAEFRPGNRRVVHHALFYLDRSGTARKRDAADPGLGYGSFGGPGFIPSGSIGGWAPGGTPQPLRDGMGRRLQKGSDLVLQIHYHPTGKAEIDQSAIGIHFVKQKSQKAVFPVTIIDRRLCLPAGAERHRMSGSYTLPFDTTLVVVVPHMHLLGREAKATAKLPDGTVEPLVWIKDWDFNWQDQYHLARPRKFPKGTRFDYEAVYDNSGTNPLNPNSPPREVTWGEETTDEMFLCFFLVTVDRPEDQVPLMLDNLRVMGAGLKKPEKPGVEETARRDAGPYE
jgi:mono/diheme cytochrome c family protein/peroxiredoxin